MQKSLNSTRQKALLRILRDIREQSGLRQSDIANWLDQPQSFVSKYESGERRLDLLELELVCDACGIELSEVVRRYQAATKT